MHGLEVWKTKTDKNPRRFPKTTIAEYAIKKDTFRVIHQFKPFEKTNTYFELTEARALSRGKVNLYIIDNYANPQRVSTYTRGGLIPALIDESMGNYTYMYLLEEVETGFLKALSSKKEELKETLVEFFPEKYISKYNQVKGGINYKAIPDLVKLYNSK